MVAILPKWEPMPAHLRSLVGNQFLQKAPKANPLVRLTTSKVRPPDFPAGAVTVFHRETPAKLPPRNVPVVDSTTNCDLRTVGDKL